MTGLSLADLRAAPGRGLPERAYDVSLAGRAVGRVNAILDEAQDLINERADLTRPTADDTGEPVKKPQRLGQGAPPRVKEIDDRLAELDTERASLRPEIESLSGTLMIRAVEPQKWRAFANDNPARQVDTADGPALDPRDVRWGGGLIDTDAVFAKLDDFVKQWNGENLGDTDWEQVFVTSISPGDINHIVRAVVELHEVARDIPKLLSVSLSTGQNAND